MAATNALGVNSTKYYVIQFIGMLEECGLRYVPSRWVKCRNPEYIVTLYPPRGEIITENYICSNEQPLSHWKPYLGIIMYETDIFEQGMLYIIYYNFCCRTNLY